MTHQEIKEKLEKLSYQREQMGPVNLRAKIEESEVQSMIDELELEKNDLYEAVQNLERLLIKLIKKEKTVLLKLLKKLIKIFLNCLKNYLVVVKLSLSL